MARVTVEDCLDKVDNRFDLVMISAKRARQIATGGKEPLVKEENDKPTVLALREIEQGLVSRRSIEAEERADEVAAEIADQATSIEVRSPFINQNVESI